MSVPVLTLTHAEVGILVNLAGHVDLDEERAGADVVDVWRRVRAVPAGVEATLRIVP